MSADDLDARRRRAALRRQRATLTRTPLAASRPPAPPTALERLALLTQLSDEAWLLSGRPFPRYRRSEMPGRVIRPGEPRD
ncbi:MAG: hypothetical protein R3F65_33515 [bacterium]